MFSEEPGRLKKREPYTGDNLKRVVVTLYVKRECRKCLLEVN